MYKHWGSYFTKIDHKLFGAYRGGGKTSGWSNPHCSHCHPYDTQPLKHQGYQATTLLKKIMAAFSVILDLTQEENHPHPNAKEEEAAIFLSWKLGYPSRTSSDWTIVIHYDQDLVHEPSQPVQVYKTYHVHTHHLCFGKHSSLYFYSLFHSRTYSEARTRTSHITLPNTAAHAFPTILDYIYVDNVQTCITTDNAIALKFLLLFFLCHWLAYCACE